MTLKKARFTLFGEDGQLDQSTSFDVLYNPTQYTTNKTVRYAEQAIPGLDSPVIQFVSGQTETIGFDLFFDTTDESQGGAPRPVTEETDKVYSLVKLRGEQHAPPVCLFSWGGGFPGSQLDETIGSQRQQGFKCVVESVRQQFTFFHSTGVPLRAVVTVALREYKVLADQLNELNPRSADQTRFHAVSQGDTLAAVAAVAYGDPGQWRRIANENRLTDPLALPVGALLTIPPVP
jgi:Contractile injection system tube protein